MPSRHRIPFLPMPPNQSPRLIQNPLSRAIRKLQSNRLFPLPAGPALRRGKPLPNRAYHICFPLCCSRASPPHVRLEPLSPALRVFHSALRQSFSITASSSFEF